MNEQPFDALSVAHEFIGASMSVLPIKADGSKKPSLRSWKKYQNRLATDAEIKAWFGSGEAGIAVVGGKVSGNLLILDFDKDAEVVFAQFRDKVERESPGLIGRLPLVRTPSGGAHLFCRTTGNCPGNAKLAQRPTNQDSPKQKHDTLIETRGNGGYVLTIGSPSSCHPSGKKYVHDSLTPWPWLTPVIDDEELDTLLTVATSFDDMPVKTVEPPKRPATSEGARPGDEYNRRGDALALLLKHGWTVCREHGGVTYLTRPGKTRGESATFGHCRTKDGVPLLRNFSTSSGLDLKAYSPFSLFAHLECGGD
ncbi:MAG: hypothetical protein EBV06_11505, partial [Planctomycetia bacterium]|nr:hypothetical protein [Planctomycetia bacterium]